VRLLAPRPARTVVVGVSLLMGFRTSANVLQWLAVIGLVRLFILAISWVSAALGLLASTPDGASGYAFASCSCPT